MYAQQHVDISHIVAKHMTGCSIFSMVQYFSQTNYWSYTLLLEPLFLCALKAFL